MDPQEIIAQLKGIRCPSTIRQQGMSVTSCPDAIAKAIEKVVKASQAGTLPTPLIASTPPVNPDLSPAAAKLAKFCPECGSKLEHEGGCVICRDCGYSKCG